MTAAAGLLPGGLPGLGAGHVPFDPRPASTAPFTVLLLGSDDDFKFPPDRLNMQSMVLLPDVSANSQRSHTSR
jgi:hypothetical protein